MNIVLTGFMGTGKTVVGKLLAEKLSYQYIDTDESIEKDTGLKISEIFKNKGESYFREAESKVIILVSMLDKAVIATGGGVPLNKDNMKELEKTGKIVCLRAKPETIYERLKGDSTRPLLKKPDPMLEIKELLQSREKYYKRCWLVIDTDTLKPEEITEKLIGKLG